MEEITSQEAAKILGVSSAHVRWYYGKGLLPGRRIGQLTLVFRREDVENFVKPTKTGRPRKAAPVKKPKPRKRPAKGK